MRPSVLSSKESGGPAPVFFADRLRSAPPAAAKNGLHPISRKSTQPHPCHPHAPLSPNQPPEPTRLSGVGRSHRPSPLTPIFQSKGPTARSTARGSPLTFGLYLRRKSEMRPSVLSPKESSGPTAVFAPTDWIAVNVSCSREKRPASLSHGQSTQPYPCHPQATLSPNQPPEPTRLCGVVRSCGPRPLTPTFSFEETVCTLDGARLISNVRQREHHGRLL
jgi:hypothetical protein